MKYLCLFLLIIFVACQYETNKQTPRVFIIQPLGAISPKLSKAMLNKLAVINPNVILKEPLPLPVSAYYAPRSWYRADSLIRLLNTFKNNDSVVMGLTEKDISTTKDAYND